MASLPVFNKEGVEVGAYEIDPDEIAGKISKQLLHDAVVMYQANLRQGSHRTKSRAVVAGSTKKLYRQKGTGNARQGSRRTNVRRGGGHAFARKARDYSYRLPKKAVRTATRMAIASKLKDEQVVLLDELSFESPRTKDMATILNALGLSGRSVLIATAEHDANTYKSARNIARVSVSRVSDLNALSVLSPQRILATTSAMDLIKQRTAT